MDFSLYSQNVIWPGGGGLNYYQKYSEKAEHPQICQSFGGNVGETIFRHRPIIPPPYFKFIQAILAAYHMLLNAH